MDPDLTSVDLYLPAGCGPVPVVMWVHGGGWRRGDKASGHVERKAAWAESLGAALVSVNYRLTTPDSGVRWPDHGEDVAAAVEWVQREGPTVGLDGTKITLVGHSAGAHLVAITATDPELLTGAGADAGAVECVVALDFSFDLASAPAQTLIVDAFGTNPRSSLRPRRTFRSNVTGRRLRGSWSSLAMVPGESMTPSRSSTSSVVPEAPPSSSMPTPTATTRSARGSVTSGDDLVTPPVSDRVVSC